ncbi:cytochrome oxidase assembly protein SHY1 [Sporobolomyces salmoneus]|uniref:cytochrome oxidase assembly protein SHY1 n=1 Tax=Sporobolomyces salmoneus TaxID=183962 RepID=UPI003171306E
MFSSSIRPATRLASRTTVPPPSILSSPIAISRSSQVAYARHASTSTSHLSQSARDKIRARPFLLLVGLMPIFTFGLGAWQIKRLKWKVDLIDQLDKKLHQEPVGLPARIDPAAIPEFAWRKVFVTGTFDHANSIVLGPKTRDGQIGYHVITPLVRGVGKDTIMVNRGFVKREVKDAKDRPASLTNEKVEIVGMLRDQEPPNSFTPKNDPSKGQWVFSDIAGMAQHTGSEPVLVDQIYGDHPGKAEVYLRQGIPVGRNASIELRNMHATYAATWFSLSLATSFMAWRLLRSPAKVNTASQFRRDLK